MPSLKGYTRWQHGSSANLQHGTTCSRAAPPRFSVAPSADTALLCFAPYFRTQVGFSGTNDNHRLLPLQVQQADMTCKPHLAATNGKMLHVLLDLARYSTLEQPKV